MAPSRSEPQVQPEIGELQRSLQTTKYELDYEKSARAVEVITKDEELRKLRFQLLLLEEENDELHKQLAEEETRGDELDADLEDARALSEENELERLRIANEFRMKNRELDNLQAELDAMQHVSADTTKLLTEKLSLARELATLKPELEHLRSQASSHQTTLSEKLSLQRQLSTVQVELETEKRTTQRLLVKDGKQSETGAELKAEIDDLRKALQIERAQREKAETSAEQAQADLDNAKASSKAAAKAKKNKKDADTAKAEELEGEISDLRKELAKEKRALGKAEEEIQRVQATHEAEKEKLEQQINKTKRSRKEDDAESSAELDGLRAEVKSLGNELKQANDNVKDAQKELETERALSKKLAKEKGAKATEESNIALEDLRKQLSEAQKDRKRAEKEHEMARKDWEGKKSILDEKLDAFRTKLRSTKEALKEKETELQKAQSQPAAKTVKATAKATNPIKTSRKRKAQADPAADETTLGTPGDMPAKKVKRSFSTAPGDKSTFSITPFLNRTTSIAPDSPNSDRASSPIVEGGLESDPIETAAEDTPSALPKQKKVNVSKPKPLATVPANKANSKTKPARKKSTAVPSLEMVAEEGVDVEDENTDPAVVPEKTVEMGAIPKLKPTSMPSKAPRKSLMSFATFDSDAPEKKKKRKLGGSSLAKTLFDDDEGAPPAKPIPGKGLFAARALGKTVFSTKGTGPAISGGLRLTTEEGFQFSPLKKERKAMREASVLGG